jgi:hypothetical protein
MGGNVGSLRSKQPSRSATEAATTRSVSAMQMCAGAIVNHMHVLRVVTL